MAVHKTSLVLIVFLMALFVMPEPVSADSTALLKEADKIIRNAERNMHNGKNNEADNMLIEAAGLIERAKAEDPANTRLSRTEKKLQRTRKMLDRKLNKPAAATPAKSVSSSSSTTTASTNKLPGGVKKRLQDINRLLDSVETRGLSYNLDKAANLFAEIDKNYAGKFDPADTLFVTTRTRYETLKTQSQQQHAEKEQAKAEQAAAKAAMEQQSAEWIPKFQAYLSYPGQQGHNPDTLVFVPGTSETDKFAEAQRRYEAFKAFYLEYQSTNFPNGKTWQLEELADREAPTRLDDFEKGFASRVSSVTGDAEQQIKSAMTQLERDNGWQSDKTIMPPIIDGNRMHSIEQQVTKTIAATGENSPQAQQLQQQLLALINKDREHREVRKQRTFMTPDKYHGNDLDAIKQKAESLVSGNKKEGGQPLRSTVISENWKEDSRWEWTDTSRTQRRWRTTRSLTAQVAARTGDGVRLITVAIAKDKQSDGSWGPLYGNLHQYSEPMLEENVDK